MIVNIAPNNVSDRIVTISINYVLTQWASAPGDGENSLTFRMGPSNSDKSNYLESEISRSQMCYLWSEICGYSFIYLFKMAPYINNVAHLH